MDDGTSVGLGYLYFDTGKNYTMLGSKGLATVDDFCKSKLPNAHAVKICNQEQQSFLAQKACEIEKSTGISRDWWIRLQRFGQSWICHSTSRNYTSWGKTEPFPGENFACFEFYWRYAANSLINVWPLCQVDPVAIKVSSSVYLLMSVLFQLL